mmetsp:Transcript_37423/g.73648  ORF Transcript_37423/g.73648 Transcript_37423/m.73648 type:complete len:151 (-) Transcript_37423:811-1263(-)
MKASFPFFLSDTVDRDIQINNLPAFRCFLAYYACIEQIHQAWLMQAPCETHQFTRLGAWEISSQALVDLRIEREADLRELEWLKEHKKQRKEPDQVCSLSVRQKKAKKAMPAGTESKQRVGEEEGSFKDPQKVLSGSSLFRELIIRPSCN